MKNKFNVKARRFIASVITAGALSLPFAASADISTFNCKVTVHSADVTAFHCPDGVNTLSDETTRDISSFITPISPKEEKTWSCDILQGNGKPNWMCKRAH